MSECPGKPDECPHIRRMEVTYQELLDERDELEEERGRLVKALRALANRHVIDAVRDAKALLKKYDVH